MFKFFDKVKKSKVGYTLTELIVVVAILGILAAIGIPMIMNSRQDAADKADEASISVIENAIQICIADGKLKMNAANTKIDGSGAEISAVVKKRLVGQIFPLNNKNSGHGWFLDAETGKVYTTQKADNSLLPLA